ncbi:MAG: hypothetical protein GY765_16855 [bacterium]|nr:hypothetical protein [bacterium]
MLSPNSFDTTELSHRLNSRVTVMRGELELALRKARTPEEYRGILESVLDEVKELQLQIEQLLLSAGKSH